MLNAVKTLSVASNHCDSVIWNAGWLPIDWPLCQDLDPTLSEKVKPAPNHKSSTTVGVNTIKIDRATVLRGFFFDGNCLQHCIRSLRSVPEGIFSGSLRTDRRKSCRPKESRVNNWLDIFRNELSGKISSVFHCVLCHNNCHVSLITPVWAWRG